ncbi:SDR family oxidoreductase [Nakamurella sp. YIM 132087]|uniref:SDR family oxidoreductase n=1 Tax=Nakamurella alba TaxID=2665158 RepID=A0A7K1FQ26_9ACTN|nr:type I polyketide synthase [Nakamurella alba]MTD15353.1 SDR family oxidoreductase [Nakamurella alba]
MSVPGHHTADPTSPAAPTVSDGDIALVGLSGMFPGAADAGRLWERLLAGESGITRFSEQDLLAAGVPAERLADPAYVRAGAVLDGVDLFDAGFFGFGPAEAQILDPQHRLFLEHSWRALEDAGCDPDRFDGAIGVFGGSAYSTYLQNNLGPAGLGDVVGELALGLANDKDSLVLRVAHVLGLTGPAYGIQSYCSTSLVAVCAAASSLAAFECDLALAGGAAVSVPHRVGYHYQPGGILPPDGECRAFDADGAGAPLGGGVAVVALRRLSDALADGDRVYAVLRGWAVNNDGGHKVGFTAPGPAGQAAVIGEALAAADVTPGQIGYVEAHGTGTALGDAAEIAALQQVFAGTEVRVGSVKTNVGHLDRAAGVTGLIKTALSLHHGVIPATRNLRTPNPQLALGTAAISVVTQRTDWPRSEQPRYAGVSAFGIGGTNAHVVLEEAPPVPVAPHPAPAAQLLVWSGRTAEAADRLTRDLADLLERDTTPLDAVAHTLRVGRKEFTHRRALVVTDRSAAVAALRSGALLTGASAAGPLPALGLRWLQGESIDWAVELPTDAPRKVSVPGHPLDRRRWWVDPPAAGPAAPSATALPDPAPAGPVPVELVMPVWSEWSDAAPPGSGTWFLLGDPALTGPCALALGAAGLEVTELSGIDPDGPPPAGTVVDLRFAAGPVADLASAIAPVAATVDRLGASGAGGQGYLLLTRGGQSVSGEPADPGAAGLAGLLTAARAEYPGLRTAVLDLPATVGRVAPETTPAVEHTVAEHFPAAMSVPLGAWRDGRLLVPDWQPVPAGHRSGSPVGADHADAPEGAVGSAIRAGAAYLVTGGLGPLGLRLADHLVEAGAGRLVLLGRSEPGPAATQAIEAWRARDVMVEAVRGDVRDPALLGRLLDGVAGVLHAAADTRRETFRPLGMLDDDCVAAHLGAKLDGARALAAAVADRPESGRPDFCLTFSSTSAILGGIAFGSYAAANAALVAVGSTAPAGTRWSTVLWDTWADTLPADDGGPVGAGMRVHAMATDRALAALDAVLAGGRSVTAVVAGGLTDRLSGTVGPGADLVPMPVLDGPRVPRPDLPQPYLPPRTAIQRRVAEIWSAVLGVEPVGLRDNFFDLSGNSLLALQMLTLLGREYGVTVPTVRLFESPTVQGLAEVLDGANATAVVPVLSPPAPAPRQAGIPGAPAPVGPALPVPPLGIPGTVEDTDRHIAIIGMAGRFPGAADVAAFWRNLCAGDESISFFDQDELRAAGVPEAEFTAPGYVPARPVLDDVAGFDAAFFGLSPRMAALTDPQQRIFLEVCWEALESAGYGAPEHRPRVGVYGGCNLSTYLLHMPDEVFTGGDVSTYEIIMGNEKDALTTNVSYLFDLRGPSVAVQTFCSTSLVATHLAVQALRAGDCEMALAGGVSIRTPDRVGHHFAPGGQESPDGHVRAFDAAARGSMFGDGAAVVVLKRLDAALRDGDDITAVIRGSAMNNDGSRKVGFTAPSVVGQARVVADALADAGVRGADVGYVEAHGTGTELGDPIEVAALTMAFAATGAAGDPGSCGIGSVKTNVGHLDRAAGATGLIKTALAVREGHLPATLHYTAPNPEIDFAAGPFRVVDTQTAWAAGDRPRIAGLNSLGMGGTNVHVVVQEPPVRPLVLPDPLRDRRFHVLPVSARTGPAMDDGLTRMADHLGSHVLAPADVAYTLQTGRTVFEHRAVVVAGDLLSASAAFAGGDGLLRRAEALRGRPVALLLDGVGEQYPGMVGELARREPAFAARLDEVLGLLAGEEQATGVDLRDLLCGARPDAGGGLAAMLGRAPEPDARSRELARTELVQPLVFAAEWALARTLMDWGVEPVGMVGYSLGEYVAAALSGVLTLPEAVRLVAHRARLIAGLPGGAMVAVGLGEAELAERCDPAAFGLDIAALNGPGVTVVAGPVEAAEAYQAELRRAGIAARALATTHAFHSRMLEPVAAALTEWVAGNITPSAPQIPYTSNVTGGPATAGLVADPGYWARHMCGTVRFADQTAVLVRDATDSQAAVVEIGAGQSLGALLRAALPPDRWGQVLPTLPGAAEPAPADRTVADALARMWLLGVDLDWTAVAGRSGPAPLQADAQPHRVPLPTYAFQRRRYWLDRTRSMSAGGGSGAVPAAPTSENLLEVIGALPVLEEKDWLQLPVFDPTPPPPAAGRPLRRVVLDTPCSAGTPAVPGMDGAAGAPVRLGADLERARQLVREWRDADALPDRVTLVVDRSPAALLGVAAALARAAGESGWRDWRLEILTHGAQSVAGEPVTDPEAASAAGPALVLPLEFPGLQVSWIDLPDIAGPADPRTDAALAAELAGAGDDPVVVLRGGRRFVPGFRTLPATAGAPGPAGAAAPGGATAAATATATGTAIGTATAGTALADNGGPIARAGGCYLITGGLGTLALQVARELAGQAPCTFVLLARRPLPERSAWAALLADPSTDPGLRRRLAGCAEILAAGSEVEVVVGDVTDTAAVRRAVETAQQRYGRLDGVWHMAGTAGRGLVLYKEPDQAGAAADPKVTGLRALAEALRIGGPDEIRLDHLVLFSSIAAFTGGGPGQYDYAAGNAVLGSRALQWNAPGRRVLAIDWGEWTDNAWEDGLAGYDPAVQQFFVDNRARIGIGVAAGLRAAARALATGEPRVVVCSQDATTLTTGSRLFTVEAVAGTGGGRRPTGPRHPRPDLLTPYQEPVGDLELFIARTWCEALHLEQVGVLDNFFELGGNSLLGVGIVAAVREHQQLDDLPPHILYEAPTVATLALAVGAAALDPADLAGSGGDGSAGGDQEAEGGSSTVRAQLRRSGLQASARRRAREDA